MRVGGIYSFNRGQEVVEAQFRTELEEIYQAISLVDGEQHRTKISKEITMPGKTLYSPRALNKAFNEVFGPMGWAKHREICDYPLDFYTSDYEPKTNATGAYREMDFVKNKLGVEVQFGKYAFMVYNVAAKMTIFRNLGIIDAGVEIVPLRELARQMSTGVSYFEQFVWDLEHRGVSNIDVPVLILGVVP
jgi:hypothetical protein